MSRFSRRKPGPNFFSILAAALAIAVPFASGQPVPAQTTVAFALPEKPLRIDAGKFLSERRKGTAAYLRVIYLLPNEAGPLRLEIKPAVGEKSEMTFSQQFVNPLYLPTGLGTTTFKLTRQNNPEEALVDAVAVFGPNAYATLWIVPKDGTLAFYLTDDNYDRAAPVNRLVVHNYFPGATVSLTSLREPASGPPTAENILPLIRHRGLKYGEAQGFDQLAVSGDLYLRIEAMMPDGRTENSLRTLKYGNIRRYSLVFKPDAYGYFASEVFFDGPPLDAEASLEVDAPAEPEPAPGAPAK